MKAKVALSPALEAKFFEDRLAKHEQERLKAICEAYQSFAALNWSANSFRPYSQYFGFINALKTKAVFEELIEFGYLNIFDKSLKIYDLGAGTLGASLGATDALRKTQLQISQLIAIDKETSPTEWALNTFKDFLPDSTKIGAHLPELENSSVLLMANVWNESLLRPGSEKFEAKTLGFLQRLLKRASDDQIFVFIEPASHAINEKFLGLRDELSADANVLLPCTHQLACPARIQSEWCHEERSFAAPNKFREIVRYLGFRQRTLSFSMLVLGKQPTRFKPEMARCVSSELGGKGRSEKWLCSQGKRWKESQLVRHKNETNSSYYDARRGDIIDCASTLPESDG